MRSKFPRKRDLKMKTSQRPKIEENPPKNPQIDPQDQILAVSGKTNGRCQVSSNTNGMVKMQSNNGQVESITENLEEKSDKSPKIARKVPQFFCQYKPSENEKKCPPDITPKSSKKSSKIVTKYKKAHSPQCRYALGGGGWGGGQ